jgi:hypothetical protein
LAQEAKDRQIVEGFFFRRLRAEDGKTIRRLLVKSPPGLGKTREAIDWAVRYQAEQEGKDGTRLSLADFNEAGVPAQTSIFVPRHQLAEELREVIERAFLDRGELIRVPILRGRENGGAEGNAPCRRWRGAHELARKGLPIYTNLCERKSDGQWSQCPLLRRVRVPPDAAGRALLAIRDPSAFPSRAWVGRRCGAADARPLASDQRDLAIEPSHCKTPLPAQFPRDLVYPVNSQQ